MFPSFSHFLEAKLLLILLHHNKETLLEYLLVLFLESVRESLVSGNYCSLDIKLQTRVFFLDLDSRNQHVGSTGRFQSFLVYKR